MSQRQAVRNAADASQVKEAKRAEKDVETLYAADFLAIAESPAGQRVLRRVLDRAGLFQTGLGANDALTNFRAGKRESGLQVVNDLIAYAPHLLAAILITPEDPA